MVFVSQLEETDSYKKNVNRILPSTLCAMDRPRSYNTVWLLFRLAIKIGMTVGHSKQSENSLW